MIKPDYIPYHKLKIPLNDNVLQFILNPLYKDLPKFIVDDAHGGLYLTCDYSTADLNDIDRVCVCLSNKAE